MSELDKALKEIAKQFSGEAENVKSLIADEFRSLASDIEGAFDGCGSPIEKLFSLALQEAVYKASAWDPLFKHFDVFEIERQVKIHYGNEGKYYKADFLVSLADHRYGLFNYIIECDGHDFHEKTKQQVKADKKRERDFLERGYVFMRFTGSEINESPYVCAREALTSIKGHLESVLQNIEEVNRKRERKESGSLG